MIKDYTIVIIIILIWILICLGLFCNIPIYEHTEYIGEVIQLTNQAKKPEVIIKINNQRVIASYNRLPIVIKDKVIVKYYKPIPNIFNCTAGSEYWEIKEIIYE